MLALNIIIIIVNSHICLWGCFSIKIFTYLITKKNAKTRANVDGPTQMRVRGVGAGAKVGWDGV